jgi:hypothetical protein
VKGEAVDDMMTVERRRRRRRGLRSGRLCMLAGRGWAGGRRKEEGKEKT